MKTRPFYSPNLKSNKASKISALFGKNPVKNSDRNNKDSKGKINTFQERLDRFKINNRLIKKTNSRKNLISEKENQETRLSDNFEFFSKENKNVKTTCISN